MKIVEEITIDNSDKVIMGPKKVKIGYDTETGKVKLNTPAIWGGDAEMDLSTLRDTLDKLEAHTTSGKAHTSPIAVKDLALGAEFYWGGYVYCVQEKLSDRVRTTSLTAPVQMGLLFGARESTTDGHFDFPWDIPVVEK